MRTRRIIHTLPLTGELPKEPPTFERLLDAYLAWTATLYGIVPDLMNTVIGYDQMIEYAILFEKEYPAYVSLVKQARKYSFNHATLGALHYRIHTDHRIMTDRLKCAP